MDEPQGLKGLQPTILTIILLKIKSVVQKFLCSLYFQRSPRFFNWLQ